MISFIAVWQFILEWLSVLRQFHVLRFVSSHEKDLEIISLRTQVALMNHEIEAGKLPKPKATPFFRHFWRANFRILACMGKNYSFLFYADY